MHPGGDNEVVEAKGYPTSTLSRSCVIWQEGIVILGDNYLATILHCDPAGIAALILGST
jgi:hypothetical protein